jgi:hypothetical protein
MEVLLMGSMTLTSLALLKAHFDIERKDIIDAFISFAEISISKRNLEKIIPEELKLWLCEDFGLEIPLPPIILICNRMVKRGILKRTDKKYDVIHLSADLASFEKKKVELNNNYRAILTAFRAFIKEKINLEWTEEECEQGLLNYIDEYSIDCVKAFANGDHVPIHGKKSEKENFIVSSFVNHISNISPEQFRYFVTIITGRMLSNALLASDLTALGKRFIETSIYLDTPIILQILGVLGSQIKSYSDEILELFISSGASIHVFSHTLRETEYVLKSAERFLEMPTGGRGNVIVAVREAGMSASDVTLIRSDLPKSLKAKGIEIKDTPSYAHYTEQIDEEALEQEMELVDLFYRSDAAKRTDINSIRSIFVLRKGFSPKRVEESRAILVTNNSGLAQAAFSYGRNHEELRQVSPVITDFSLTNIIWLKSPLSHPNIPQRLLLANCYSVLKPTEELWNNFLEQVDRLLDGRSITPDQHQFLRFELRVRDELMNLTLGDENGISEKIIFEILERHEQDIVRPWKENLDQARSDYLKVSDQFTQSEAKVNHIDSSLIRISKICSEIVKYALVAIAIALLLYAYIPRESSINGFSRTISGIIGWIIIALNIIRVVFGFKFIDPIQKCCNSCERNLLHLLRQIFKIT